MNRVTSAVLLAWSIAVAALLPIADARAEIAAAASQAHVEERGSASCPPVHNELACQSCRIIRLAGDQDAGGLYLVLLSAAHGLAVAAATPLPVTRVGPSSPPRAPPVA